MRRREFIAGLCTSAAWPMVARAQQARMPVIGYISARSMEADTALVAGLRQDLREVGLVDGRNVAIEYRFADYQLERLPALAADLVRRGVTIFFAVPTPAAAAAKSASTSIPIVFAAGVDPVQTGLVGSLAHPGGNITGVYTLSVAVAAKRLELLHELLPTVSPIAFFHNPANNAFTAAEVREIQMAANALGVGLLMLDARTPAEFEAGFAKIAAARAGGLVISGESLFVSNPAALAELEIRYGVPAVHPERTAAAAGALMSYGGVVGEQGRQMATYIARILKGERPADLPVQQATKVELIVNLKTARALGLTVPLPLLGRADEVIE